MMIRMDEPKKPCCALCKRENVTDAHLCAGCKSHICDECETKPEDPPWGHHRPKDHQLPDDDGDE